MTLSDYLTSNGISRGEFARRMGCSISVVSRLAAGLRKPTVGTLQKIIEASEGAVTLDDFVRHSTGSQKNGEAA